MKLHCQHRDYPCRKGEGSQTRPDVFARLEFGPASSRAGEDTQLLDKALEDRQVVMVPAVLTELLSDPKLPIGVAETLSDVPLIEIESGYWQRAGGLVRKAL